LQRTCLGAGVFVGVLGSGFGWDGRSRRLGGRALDADAAGAPARVSAVAGEAALALRPPIFTLSLLFPAPALARVVSVGHGVTLFRAALVLPVVPLALPALPRGSFDAFVVALDFRRSTR
jgi:hypothetical protein